MKKKIVFRDVSKSYNGIEAVKNLSFEVMEGETLVLIGTSGCGKTTTLKMINRLVEPSEGTIEVDGRDISRFNLIELRHNIGYVIQSVGLFPHMTVGKNIRIIPELVRWPEEKTGARMNELLSMVGLDPDTFRNRYPAELSGGQQQRIGVARALAADPPIILMDEPFGALDPITREQLQNEFLSLVRKIRKTIVFVTHDIVEAAKIADRLALMDRGRLVQIDAPKKVVESPANEFVIDFLGRQRFQLSLLLTKLSEMAAEAKEGVPEAETLPRLNVDETVLDALAYLKKYEVDVIPVEGFDGKIKGIVRKDAIRDRILESV